jgi:hypothetical protein
MPNPSVVVREYNSQTGAFVGNVTALNFGNVPVGSHSAVKVIDLAFLNVSSVSNLRIALLSTGNLIATDSPSPLVDCNPVTHAAPDGYFGIESSPSFFVNPGCIWHFRDVYDSTPAPGEQTNAVSVGMRDEGNVISDYVYLDVHLKNSDLGAQGGGYRIFFDFT